MHAQALLQQRSKSKRALTSISQARFPFAKPARRVVTGGGVVAAEILKNFGWNTDLYFFSVLAANFLRFWLVTLVTNFKNLSIKYRKLRSYNM